MPAQNFDLFCAENYERISAIATRFGDYQPGGGYDRSCAIGWLRLFQAQHRELGLRFAESIHYFSTNSINNLMAPLYERIQAEVLRVGVDVNAVYYVPLGRTAESGQQIVRMFRNANINRVREDRFVQPSDLLKVTYDHDDIAVFFLDDFIGTGKQLCDYWDDVLTQVVIEGYGKYYVAAVAAFDVGIARVEQSTPLKVLSMHPLNDNHRLMEGVSAILDGQSRNALAAYCERIANNPMGFGDLGAMVSFAHGSPNNTPSVLRGSARQRPHRGLLPGWKDL